jgi:redox-sensitive bicupin YhaK (pirin superfamily)
MGLNIVSRKDHLMKDLYQNKIRERKILGFPQEKSPVKAYSNVFYWSHLVSDFGAVVPERPMIGFEILTYVLTGAYESINKDADQ